MKARQLLTALAILACSSAALAAGDDQAESAGAPAPEVKLWKETGETGHGTIAVHRGASVPLKDLNEIDAATMEEIRQRWERFAEEWEREETPPLKYTVPVEPLAFAPLPPETGLGGLTRALDDFVLVKNSHASAAAPAGFSAIVNEPSVAAVGDLVFYTGNWYAALSTDGGDSFSFVNPFTGPFPPPASGGFCCDQVTLYEPTHNALFFLQQYAANGTTGVQRINVDLGADGTFDCMYDVTPSVLGMGPNTWPDFPDLAVSDNYLYHSSNVFSTVGAGFVGAFTARYPLDLVGTCTGTTFDVYRDFSGFFSFKLTRGATTAMYFADHISNASLRIWRWPEADAAPTSSDRAVTAWTDAARVCPGPDARDWCGRLDRRLHGAYVADGTVGFMWNPAQGGPFFTYPYTRIAQFSEAGLTLTGQPLIWSSSGAWVYPSVAVNAHGDLGGTILVGGGASLYTTCAAWIADDVNGDTMAPLENQVAFFGTTGPASNDSGDYTSTRPYFPNSYLWSGGCFGLTSTTVANARYVLFGREGNLPIFTDGFESGNTSAWSAVAP